MLGESVVSSGRTPTPQPVKAVEKVLGNDKAKIENFEKDHSLFESASKQFQTTNFRGRDASI